MHTPLLFLLPLLPLALTHTPHETPDPSTPWAARHLLSEHHINNYDAGAFFSLHDFNNDLHLSRDELLRTYGVLTPAGSDKIHPDDPPTEGADADTIWHTVADQMDTNKDDLISYEEWMAWTQKGGQLPDFGTGPGHHGDDEFEYEIHHYEKFHEGDKEDGSDMVMHPEDIEHVGFF